MTNFRFLQEEFQDFYSSAKRAEDLASPDPRGSCFYARLTLELAVHWLYDHDRSLRRPYQNRLGAMIHEPTFKELLPSQLFYKVKAIQKAGNQAAHSPRPFSHHDSMRICKELFHFLYWLARTYTRLNNPSEMQISFDPDILLTTPSVPQVSSMEDLQRREAQEVQKWNERDKYLQKQEEVISQVPTIEEREAKLRELDAELARLREELAEAKRRNLSIPDEHDYSESETRKLIIDLLLKEAGWTIGKDISLEVHVTGMPNVKGEGYVDYVLWGSNGLPLAVVEAKRTTKDARVGQRQAKLYADCLEKMKGQRPVIFYTNGYDTWIWDDLSYPPRLVQGFYTQEELQLLVERRRSRKNLLNQVVREDIVDRYYQKRVIRSLSEEFTRGQRKGLLAMATGTGKTRTAIALVEILMRCNWVKRVLFLADRVALVNQAVNAFKKHLPSSSPVNLVTERNSQGRIYVSTYPTMMGLINGMDGDQRTFGVGYFDLIIIDEAHRSVYQKYKAIFGYFDSLLVGLTATPRDEVHHDTYQLFDLETGIPTDAYSLEEAVEDKYLVPPKGISVPLKFPREGIHYHDLTEEEREQWESLDWGDRYPEGSPEDVDPNSVNKWLFNEDTVDKVLKHLMQKGLKVQGGDVLGKTIIFAKNHAHAMFIEERFNLHYPHLRGHFARIIDNYETYAQSILDDFTSVDKYPQIAISVDMLDTGIDVPEVVNLVFFKIVRSRTKFLQMIGRGTRLCENLFAPGENKQFFYIFDYCGNLEYFSEEPETSEGSEVEPLSKKLFKRRLQLIEAIQNLLDEEGALNEEESKPLHGLRQEIVDVLYHEVCAMNVDNFIVRPKRRYVDRFQDRQAWDLLDMEKLSDLYHHVAGLPTEQEGEDITARLFDLTCLNLQLAQVENSASFGRLKEKVQDMASELEHKENIPSVKEQMELILEVQADEYWEDISLPMIENVRRRLRGLIRFIDKKKSQPVYTALKDDIGEGEEIQIGTFNTGINLKQYRQKVEHFIRANKDHVAIRKLRYNLPLTQTDLSELERFLYESGEVRSREQFQKVFGDQKLPLFIRSLVGLDREAAMKVFSKYLDETNFNSSQIRFVEMIVDHLTRRGVMDPARLYEQPFTGIHFEGLDGLFGPAEATEIVDLLDYINANVEPLGVV